MLLCTILRGSLSCSRLIFTFMIGFVLAGPVMQVSASEQKSAVKVVELFTSQGCSSCPPADALLQSYVKNPDVIALSYSVDYWDYLGWRDTYGSAANSARQRAYAKYRGDRAVYTPQVVVNGLVHVNGAQKFAINKELEETQRDLKAKPVTMGYQVLGEKVFIEATTKVTDWSQTPVLWLVRVKDVGRVAIKRGENTGKTIDYHNIVLGVEKIAMMTGAQLEVAISKERVIKQTGEHGVFLLQVGASGPILAAVEVR